MNIKKTKISSRSLGAYAGQGSKPSTVTRAAITADIKPTRGKELVEHNPAALIPDPHNPRPGDLIDDLWLKNHLFTGEDRCLCRLDLASNEYFIPKAEELDFALPKDIREHYDFLRGLAFSIRLDGLIEPIEIFLADKTNDPEYFENSEQDYGYVVLEGHQRRLAAIMAGVKTVTCIQITDETMLAKLKVKHRKLRRQLSENNLRKGLSVAQNFKIVKELLKSEDSANISVKELSTIIGLNEDISGALKRLSLKSENYPSAMLRLIEENTVSFKWIRTWISKSPDEIQNELDRLNASTSQGIPVREPKVKARGRQGGAVKRSAIFKITKEQDSKILQNYLLMKIPELSLDQVYESPFNNLEKMLDRLLILAKNENPTAVG